LLTGAPAGDARFVFGIKPEELSFTEPSRLQVQQTLGGAWADSFDRGIGFITLAGTTGWRGTATQSGEDMFFGLRETCFQGWHDARTDLAQQGQDPNGVQLYFTDSLDKISVLVAPRSFMMRRSKASPLLMRYQIQLVVLDDASAPVNVIDSIMSALSNPLRWLSAVTGLQNALAQVQGFFQAATAVFNAATGIITGFINTGVAIIQGVVGAAIATVGAFSEATVALLNIGVQFSFAAANAFNVLASDVTLIKEIALPFQSLASLFNDAACSMANGFDLIGKFPSMDGFRGASTCSSTGGGDPASPFTLQGVSPFAYYIPSIEPSINVTPDSQLAMQALTGDPLLLMGQQPAVVDLMRRTTQGISTS
jgi:hypothetical protein